MLIDDGRVVYDGALEALRTRWGRQRTLVVDLSQPVERIDVPSAALVRQEGPRVWLQFDRTEITAAELITSVASRYPIRDLTVEEPEIETVVGGIYRGEV